MSDYPMVANEAFPSPFASYSQSFFPRNIKEVFDWAEYLWIHNGFYSQAISNALAYFITDVSLYDGAGKPTKKATSDKYRSLLFDPQGGSIINTLMVIGTDYMAFGNSFTSIFYPSDRTLSCPSCKISKAISEVGYKYEKKHFKGKCAGCGKDVTFLVLDTPVSKAAPRVIRWNPRDIYIEHCPITGESRYYLKPDNHWARALGASSRLYYETVPLELLECLSEGSMFQMDYRTFKHLKCDTIASFNTLLFGWGLPPFMNEFEQVLYRKILERYNEAIIMDYLVPFRLITPAGSPSGDALRTADMSKWRTNMENLIKNHRKNPATWYTSAIPVDYKALGGEAKQLVPTELMAMAADEILSTMAIPQELYKPKLGQAVNPVGLRHFERVWGPRVSSLDEWICWYLDNISSTNKWEKVTGRLVKTSLYEDDGVKNLKYDMAAARQISETTMFKMIGLDRDFEKQQLREEEEEDNRLAMEAQERAQKAMELNEQVKTPTPMTTDTMNQLAAQAQGGAPGGAGGGGGAPAPQGGGMPNLGSIGGGGSIDDLNAQADDLSSQLITMQPTERRRMITQLREQNKTLHALVTTMLKQKEQQAGQQGKEMARSGQL